MTNPLLFNDTFHEKTTAAVRISSNIDQYMDLWENISRDLDAIVKNTNKRYKSYQITWIWSLHSYFRSSSAPPTNNRNISSRLKNEKFLTLNASYKTAEDLGGTSTK